MTKAERVVPVPLRPPQIPRGLPGDRTPPLSRPHKSHGIRDVVTDITSSLECHFNTLHPVLTRRTTYSAVSTNGMSARGMQQSLTSTSDTKLSVSTWGAARRNSSLHPAKRYPHSNHAPSRYEKRFSRQLSALINTWRRVTAPHTKAPPHLILKQILFQTPFNSFLHVIIPVVLLVVLHRHFVAAATNTTICTC